MHIFFIITSILFSNTSPDPWNGYSVSNSENLDAFTYNPAGVSINHGIESGYFFAPDSSGYVSNNSTVYYATKSNGFGYSLKYNKGDKLFIIVSFFTFKLLFPTSKLLLLMALVLTLSTL